MFNSLDIPTKIKEIHYRAGKITSLIFFNTKEFDGYNKNNKIDLTFLILYTKYIVN